MQLVSPAQRRWLVGILLLHFVVAFIISNHQGLTYDEGGYYNYVVKWQQGNYSRSHQLDDSKTPVLALVAMPLLLKKWIPTWWEDHIGNQYIRQSRFLMYLYFLPGALFSFFLFYRLAGPHRWRVPFLLLLFNPMVLSYSLVVGSDIALMGISVASVYLLWRFVQTLQWRYLFWLGVALPIGLLTKQAYVYNLALLLLLFVYFWQQIAAFRSWLSGLRLLLCVGWLCLSGIVIINSFFLWRQSFVPWGNLPFQSHLLQNLQAHTTWLKHILVPLPWGFLNGYDFLQLHSEWGTSHPLATYRGVAICQMYSADGPIPTYYLLAALFKMPLLYWFIGVAGSILMVRLVVSKNFLPFWQKYGFVLISVLFLFIAISVFNPFQTGFRHALLLFPFVCLLLGVAGWRLWQKKTTRYALVIVAAISVAGIVRYGPYQMAYTNELIWNKKNVYHYLVDSSVDYGQDLEWIQRYVATNPQYQLTVPLQPRPGKYILFSPSYYPSEAADPQLKSSRAEWLIQHFEPVAHIRFTGMVYVVSASDLKGKRL